jgi:hypothetical protein
MANFANSVLPPQASGEMFLRSKMAPHLETRSSMARPLSQQSDVHETDFEDESDLDDYSPKPSFETVGHLTYTIVGLTLTGI